MADAKLTALTEIGAAILSTDILYVVDDPIGSPISRKANFSRVATFVSGKQSLWVPATDMTPRTTNGAAATTRETNGITIAARAFDTTTSEGVTFPIVFPKKWNAGTITYVSYWTCTGGGGGQTLRFDLSAGSLANDAAINTTGLGSAVAVTDTWIADNDIHITAESAAVTVATAAVDIPTYFLIIRNVANDTLAVDAELLGIEIFYTASAPHDD